MLSKTTLLLHAYCTRPTHFKNLLLPGSFAVLLLIIAIIIHPAQAQTAPGKYLYSGRVTDSAALTGIADCTVAGINAAGQTVAYTATQAGGYFNLSAPAPLARLLITHVGYGRHAIPITAAGSTGMGNIAIQLPRQTTSLKEIKIAAAKNIVRYDLNKITYNAVLDTGNKAKTALDLMDNVPLVAVLPGDNIAVAGSGNIKILVDGKERGSAAGFAALLKSMPANSIEKIEVNTLPALKYRQDGIQNVVNVITSKKLPKGIYAGLNASANTRAGIGAGIYGLARYNKLFATVMANGSKQFNSNGGSIIQNYSSAGNSYSTRTQVDTKNNSSMADVALDYNISSKHGLRAAFTNYVTGNINDRQTDANNSSVLLPRQEHMVNDNTIQNTQLSYEGIFKNNSVLSAAGAMFRTIQEQDYTSPLSNYNYKGNGYDYSAMVNYSLPLGKWNTEFGTRGNWRIFKNNASAADDDRQDIYRLYSNVAYNISAKQQFSAGLIADEARYTAGSRYAKSFFSLLPQVNYSIMAAKQTQLAISYNHQVRRPTLQMIAPAIIITNPNTRVLGNDDLNAEKADAFKISMSTTMAKKPLIISLNYSIVTNGLIENRSLNNGIVTSQYINDVTQHAATALVYYSFNPFKDFTVRLDGEIGYTSLKSRQDAELTNNGITYRFFPYLSYKTFWDLSAQLRWFLYGRTYTAQGYRGSLYDTQFSLTKAFINGKLRTSLEIYQPFAKTTTTHSLYRDKASAAGYTSTFDARYFGLRLSYDLGNMFNAMNTKMPRGKRIIQDDTKQP